MPLLVRWFHAFIFTLIVEIPIYVAFTYRQKVPLWRSVTAGAAGTCITHPLLWFVWRHFFRSYFAYVFSGELLVSCIESATFYGIARPIRLSRAIAASFIANGASYGLGNLLRYLDLRWW